MSERERLDYDFVDLERKSEFHGNIAIYESLTNTLFARPVRPWSKDIFESFTVTLARISIGPPLTEKSD